MKPCLKGKWGRGKRGVLVIKSTCPRRTRVLCTDPAAHNHLIHLHMKKINKNGAVEMAEQAKLFEFGDPRTHVVGENYLLRSRPLTSKSTSGSAHQARAHTLNKNALKI